MIFKVGLFRKGKADLLRHVERNGVDTISFYCACTGFPVVAAAIFVKEEYPEHSEAMDRKIKALSEFYGYDEIVE